MPFLVGEADHLVFDGGAVAGTDAVDEAGILGGSHEVFPDNGMGGFIGVGEPAVPLVPVCPFVHEGEGMVLRISLFQLHMVQMEAPDIHAAGGAGFETENVQAMFLQIF